MPETVHEKHYRDRLLSVQAIAAASTPDAARHSVPGLFFADLRALCAELAAAYQELLRKEHGRIIQEPGLTVAWLRERRRVIEELGEAYLRLIESVRTRAHHAWEAAGRPPGDDPGHWLDAEAQAVVEARRQMLQRWPVGSDADIASGRAAAERGEGLDADEAFARIAGIDVEAWHKRVEEYGKDRS